MSANWNSPIERALARALDARTSEGPEAAEAVLDTYPDLPELASLLAVADRIKPALVATLPLAVQARHQRMIMAAIRSSGAARVQTRLGLGPLVFRSGLSVALVVAMAMPGTLAVADHFAQKRRTELARLAGLDSSAVPPAAAAPGVTDPTPAAEPGDTAPAGAPAAPPAPPIPALRDPVAPAVEAAASPTVPAPGLPGRSIEPAPRRRAASAEVPAGMPGSPSAALVTSIASTPSGPSPALTAPKGPATLEMAARISDVQEEDTAVRTDHKRRVDGKASEARSLRGEPGAGSRPTLRRDGPNACGTDRPTLRRAAAHPGKGTDGHGRGCPATDTNPF